MRDQILQVATELIRRNGPAGAKARPICEIVGVKAPTLYYYFEDMATLREEVVNRAFAHMLEGSGTGWRSGQGIEGLRLSWNAFLAFANDEPAMFSILANQIMNGPLPKIAIDCLAQFEATLGSPDFDGRLAYPSARSAHLLWGAALGAGFLVLARQTGLSLSSDIGEDMFDTVMGSLIPEAVERP
jgi:AcrR family transcriptional regulator